MSEKGMRCGPEMFDYLSIRSRHWRVITFQKTMAQLKNQTGSTSLTLSVIKSLHCSTFTAVNMYMHLLINKRDSLPEIKKHFFFECVELFIILDHFDMSC